MAAWDIYTYGNGAFLVTIFNAVVAIMGDGNFTTLMRLAGLFGILWVSIKAALFRTNVEWTYLIWFVLIYGVLFVPKVDVVIVDRLDPGASQVVANVPWGLGVFAGTTAAIGDWLTVSTESAMSLPDNLQYHNNGLIFGSTLMQAASQWEITDARLSANMSEFMRQCVFYDVLLRRYTWNQLLEANDTWTFIKDHTAPGGRMFAYTDAGGGQAIYNCQEGAKNVLEADWLVEVNRAASLYGLRFNKHLNMLDAKAKLLADLPVSFDYMAGISQSGGDIIRANMMANAFRRSFSAAASAADAGAAAQDFALAQAEQSQRGTYAVMGQLAAKFLPLLKNVYEGLLYGMFPFLFLVFMLPIGAKAFLAYLKNIAWLQLWAPLYAIVNLLMNLYGQSSSMAAAAQMGGQALSLATHSGLAAVNADMAIIAGYMGMSIPLIAYGLVSGGQMALTQLASQVSAVAQGAATQAAGAAATGNINLANLGAYNTGMFKHDTNATMGYGQGQYGKADGSTVSLTRDGSSYLSKPSQDLGATLDAGQTAQYARKTGLAELEAATGSAQRTYADGLATSLEAAAATTRTTGWGRNVTDGWTEGNAANYQAMYTEQSNMAQKLVDATGITKEQADRIVAQAYADASVGIDSSKTLAGKAFALGTGISGQASVGVRGTADHSETDKISQVANDLKESASSKAVQEGITALTNYGRTHAIQDSEAGSNELSARLGSTLQDTARAEEQYNAARTRSTQAADEIQKLESADQGVRANLMYEFAGTLNNAKYAYTEQLYAVGNEEKLAATAQEYWTNTRVRGMEPIEAVRAAADSVLNTGHGQNGNGTGVLGGELRRDVDDRLANREVEVGGAYAKYLEAVKGDGAIRAVNGDHQHQVTHAPLSRGMFAGAMALGLDPSNLGQPSLSDREDIRAFLDKVNQHTDPETGKVRMAINEKESALLDELWQHGQKVNVDISSGWIET